MEDDGSGRFTLRLADAELHGESRAPNPPAVFLHGFGGDLHGWDGVWDRLNGSLDAIRYDLRGFGSSRALSQAPFSHGDDLLALLDAAGIERADLIGVSMGGSVAVQFALDHPDRMHRLILISPGLMGWEWSEAWKTLWRQITGHARAGRMDEARALWLAHPLFETTRRTAAAPILAQSIARYSGAQWIADHEQACLPDLDRLPDLRTPTLLLTGAHDLPDFRLIADLIAGSGQDVTRIDLPDCGHMLPLEAPDACSAAISRFLTGG